MKYNLKTFNSEVNYYQEKLKPHLKENALVFVVVQLDNKNAFYSIAPLSMAVHNLKGDMHVAVIDKESVNLKLVREVRHVYEDKKDRLKTKKVKALMDFIKAVNKRTKTNTFKNIFEGPEFYFESNKAHFHGTIDLEFRNNWHKSYRWKELLKTAKTIWKQGYNLKRNERAGISFVLLPAKEYLELPLEDYLDSYSIALAMGLVAKKMKAKVGLASCSDRWSILANYVRTADLMSTLIGCELDKNVNEEVFKKFKVVSKLLHLDKLEFNDAVFSIHGKGYPGKSFFGENIGYPTLNKKSRWLGPGQMMLKDRYETQTEFETRDPIMRYALTETLPIDIFVKSCDVDYEKIRKRSKKIKQILDKCYKVRVIGKETKGYKTDFAVYLLTKDGKRREFISSDSDVRSKIDKEFFEKTGMKTGMYANFPSGEAFVTPEAVKGLIVGDVVINIDQSYVIKGKPIIIKVDEKGYKIKDGPANLVEKMKQERKDAAEKIRNIEKSKALPKSMTDMYKKCFNQIGEFAINLNPKAELCNYLVVNEKIARMIHIALGMGFDPDKKTIYHWDIVINSPKQKLDIYGVDKENKIHWIIKKGKFKV